ncbi:DUF2625 family protein [Streptomyces sp. NPDC052000]|uniref:DUF2625 family protein n=1 Tax=Streptomyces sp. NPDC052000 TaxID=3155676 RepID=UPI00344F764A
MRVAPSETRRSTSASQSSSAGSDSSKFYEGLRWPGWRDEARTLKNDQGLSLFPPLWSAEARQNIAGTSRRAVPMAELLGVARDSCRQFDGVDPGFLGAV